MMKRGVVLGLLFLETCLAQGLGSLASGAGGGSGSMFLSGLKNFALVPETPQNFTIEHEGTIDYNRDKNTLLYVGSPKVKLTTEYGSEMYGQSALLRLGDKYVEMNGGVSIYHAGMVSRSESARYYWEKKEVKAQKMRSKIDGFILQSEDFDIKYPTAEELAQGAEDKAYFEGEDTGVTLQDVENPDSWLKAKRIRFYPQDKITFNHMYVYAGGLPIFYLPYFSHSLNPRLGYLPVPGTRTPWGVFLKNEYGFLLGEKFIEKGMPTANHIGVLHADYRVRRGFAYGLDVIDTRMEKVAPVFDGVSFYFADDWDPQIRVEGIPRPLISKDRWRLAVQKRYELNPGSAPESWSWRLDSNLNIFSDEYMLVDFFPDIVSSDQTPDNAIFATGVQGNHVLTSLVRFAPNDYYLANERLPEISWDRVRGSLEDWNVQYEGSASFVVMSQYQPMETRRALQREYNALDVNDPRRELLASMLNDDNYLRVNTYHEIAKPKTFYGFLTLTPKMGGGYTGYQGSGRTSYNRGLFFGGVDCDVKVTGNMPFLESDLLGLSGLKHVFQPYINYSFVSTNQLDLSFPQVDSLSITTNPQSLSVGRFTAIDSLSSWNILRFGTRNTLMTDRGGETVEWLRWDVFIDAYLQDPEYNRRFSNLYSLLSWKPRSWVSFNMDSQFPFIESGAGYSEHNFYLKWIPWRFLEIMGGYNVLSSHPFLQDTSLMTGGFNMRLNDNASLSAMYRWQAKDNVLERQEYVYYRNMGTWIVGVGYYCDYNRIQYDRGLMFSFTLKEFPSMSIPFKWGAKTE